MKERYDLRLIPKGAVVITAKEREALSAHSENMKRATIEAIFADVAELLIAGMKVGSSYETLLADLQKLERKYKE